MGVEGRGDERGGEGREGREGRDGGGGERIRGGEERARDRGGRRGRRGEGDCLAIFRTAIICLIFLFESYKARASEIAAAPSQMILNQARWRRHVAEEYTRLSRALLRAGWEGAEGR